QLPSSAAFPKRWPFESLISDRRKDKRIRNLCLYKRAHRGTYIRDYGLELRSERSKWIVP
ncbi:MAG: hypothetical protein WBW58_08585, partial [Candidatus Acidiferrum sp.]